MQKSEKTESNVGLCQVCVNARRTQGAHGTVFYFCRLAETDPHFVKYPRLPVIVCSGFEKKGDAPLTRNP
jgi:hypothetical protein